jgi:hypothetical protein
MKYAALSDNMMVRKFLFHCFKSVFGSMVGTVSFISRLSLYSHNRLILVGCAFGLFPKLARIFSQPPTYYMYLKETLVKSRYNFLGMVELIEQESTKFAGNMRSIAR